MFIPIWILHSIVTLLFLVGLFGWALKDDGAWDILLPARILATLLGYAIYWVIFLAIKVCVH